jgi:small subunit ribosomal protein S2
MQTETQADSGTVNAMFKVGAHYGSIRRRRHPSAFPFIFGTKNKVEIFDLEKTSVALETAKTFVRELAEKGKMILFVSSKPEGRSIVKKAAESIQMPYVSGRWKGGTLTNFEEIRKRTKRLEDLIAKQESGELAKYTKKERLLIDREIADLKKNFSGLVSMTRLPDALFIVDIGHEAVACTEANQLDIPVITISSSDCNLTKATYAIPANDASKESIAYFIEKIVQSYASGRAR